MRKLLAAVGLLGGLWASNVTATILSYDFNLTNVSATNPAPLGASQSTLSGTLQVDNAYSDGAALVGFNMVTGSKTWTEKNLENSNQAGFWFDGAGNLNNWFIELGTLGTSTNYLAISASGFWLVEYAPNGAQLVGFANCSNCLSFAPKVTPLFHTRLIKSSEGQSVLV